MIINREFSRASAWTFTMKPVRELLEFYAVGKNWVDPFAGDNSPAEFTNDINPERKAKSHLWADEFCRGLDGMYQGVLFDPPYSYRQVSEHYKSLGLKASKIDTSYNFYTRVMDVIAPKIQLGGFAISFGWNSNGFCKRRGFEKVEIVLIAHGAHHNDTIVTVERKVTMK